MPHQWFQDGAGPGDLSRELSLVNGADDNSVDFLICQNRERQSTDISCVLIDINAQLKLVL
jgi:hypothetical protein